MKMRDVVALLAVIATSLASGCTSPRERMERISIETNPLRKARKGDLCRYRAVRIGDTPDAEGVEEVWTLRVDESAKGLAKVDVACLGPSRPTPSPSAREPGWNLRMPTADAGIAATEVLRLFHRPELTTEGMLTVVEREKPEIEGSTQTFTTLVFDRTRDARQIIVRIIEAKPYFRGTYRVVVVDELAVLGIIEAELDEEWDTVDPDGELSRQHRHDSLKLVESRSASDK
jgi:hypothetical protein